jgi:hypothetical protein
LFAGLVRRGAGTLAANEDVAGTTTAIVSVATEMAIKIIRRSSATM